MSSDYIPTLECFLNKKSPIRILVVEDNPFDQELLQREIAKTSLKEHVLFLSAPQPALDLLRGPEAERIKRDLWALFLDVNLPQMSGIDLLRIVRSLDGMADLPVLVMTSAPNPDTIAACEELKVMAFVEKPVRYNDLSKVIANLSHQTSLAAG
jgi:CheY-like chemotaxis protein